MVPPSKMNIESKIIVVFTVISIFSRIFVNSDENVDHAWVNSSRIFVNSDKNADHAWANFSRVIVDSDKNVEYSWAKDTLQKSCGEIIYVGLVHRHGDRSPTHTYPNDPNKNHNWFVNEGDLLPRGLNRTYHLGKYLHSRYKHVCGEVYNKANFIYESSNVARTVESGMNVINGMFPADKDPVFENWGGGDNLLSHYHVPRYLSYNRSNDDNTISFMAKCPRADSAKEKFWNNDPKVIEICEKYADFYNYTLKHAGFDPNTLCASAKGRKVISALYGSLYIEAQHGVKQPKSVSDYPNYVKTLADFAGMSFNLEVEDDTIKKLRWTPSSQIFQRDMIVTKSKINRNKSIEEMNKKSETVKCHFLSGHDLTIATQMRGFGCYNQQVPPYASFLSHELRINEKGDLFVTTFLQNDTNSAPHQLHVKGCPDMCCPFETWSSLINPYSVSDWKAECQMDGEKN